MYIHVPFCVSRCLYCDFNTYVGMERHAEAYFASLEKEIALFWENAKTRRKDADTAFTGDGAGSERKDVAAAFTGDGTESGRKYADTAFIGGGTPSSVDPQYIARLLGMISHDRWECTIEANPGSLNRDKLNAYAAAGINRLSIGLQSTHESHLKMLGRIHSFEDFLKNYREAINAGFVNINADLLFGLPGQTMGEWRRTLEAVVALGLPHLSCYSLSVEEGTPLHAALMNGELPRPDEDSDRDMYHFAVDYLRSAGICQYELSNFARPGYECRHNLKYWTGERYRGFGAGAHSFDKHARYANVNSIADYIKRFKNASTKENAGAYEIGSSDNGNDNGNGNGYGGALADRESDLAALNSYMPIDASEAEKEFIILRLRLTDGFRDSDFRARFGYGFFEKYGAEACDLISDGLISADAGGGVKLTLKGMDLANQVFIKFI